MRRELLEERKQTVYGLICDEFYVPMKAKEMAILMNVPKAQRHELQEVLDAQGLSGAALARQLGISGVAVSRTLAGQLHSPKVLDWLRAHGAPEKYLCDPRTCDC